MVSALVQRAARLLCVGFEGRDVSREIAELVALLATSPSAAASLSFLASLAGASGA